MKAIVCKCAGGPEVMEIKNVPIPNPQDDEILVKMEATAVNRADTL